MVTYSVVILRDNARPHTSARTRALLEHFNWELFDHPPYSPDLASSDYHLITYLKNWLGSQRFNDNEDSLQSVVETLLSSQAADFFDTGVQKLIPRHDKFLNSGDDHVYKHARIFLYIIIFFSLLVLLTAYRRLLSE
jgi:histone-lysine N-methyltransferase SETMAR